MAEQQQRDQDVISYGAFSGLRNDVDPERFDTPDLFLANNVDLDKSGRLSRRAGYTAKATGPSHSLWSDGSTCLFVTGNILKRLNTDLISSASICIVTAGLRMSYAKVSDRIYFSNSVDAGIIENGNSRTWGIAPPALPGVALTVGDMPAGTYQFAMTYFRGDGQESGAPLAGVIEVPTNGGLNFTLPVSADPGVVTKAIYLSTPNGEGKVMYLALLVGNSVTTASYTHDTTELKLPIQTQFMSGAPPGQLVTYYRGHMLVASDDVIYPSEDMGYEWFDLRKYIHVDGRVTMMATIEDKDSGAANSGLFIGTDRGCGVLAGSDPNDFQYVPKTNYGVILGALDYVDGSLFGDNSTGARLLPMWLTTEGICVGMPDMNIKNLTRTKYSFPVSGVGAALFQPGANRFIATTNY